MTGTSVGGKKAAETRRQKDPLAFSKMGHEGGVARQSKPDDEKSQIAKKAAETRRQKDPEVFKKMGGKGGSSSHKIHKK